MPILGDFAVKYGADADSLGVPTDDLYQALVDTAENTVCRVAHRLCRLTGLFSHRIGI